MLPAMLAATVMVLLTVSIHYEGLQVIGRLLVWRALRGRRAMLVTMIGLFALHTVEVWLYALAYAVLIRIDGLGSFSGMFEGGVPDFTYFSVVSYTSLGLGDVYPHGGLRLVTGVEALNGLVLIGWSASYSYLVMERLWGFPGRHGARVESD